MIDPSSLATYVFGFLLLMLGLAAWFMLEPYIAAAIRYIKAKDCWRDPRR